MKKYLFTSAAALAFCGLFTSCTHDLGYDEEAAAAQNSVMKTYEQAFITAFGQPDPNNEWGFGTSTASTRAMTRANVDFTDYFGGYTPQEYYQDQSDWQWKYRNYSFPSAPASYPTGKPNNATYYEGGYISLSGGSYYMDENTSKHVEVQGYCDLYVVKSGAGEGRVTIESSTKWYIGNVSSGQKIRVFVCPGVDLVIPTNDASNLQSNTEYYISSGASLSCNTRMPLNSTKIYVENGASVSGTWIEVNGTGLLYNQGTVTASEKLTVENGTSVLVNDGTITVGSTTTREGIVYTAGSGRIQNNGQMTVYGTTTINSNNNMWVNNNHYTTDYFNYTAGSINVINNCRLDVVEDFSINLGDGNGSFKMNSNCGVTTKNFYLGGTTGGPSTIIMGSNSVFKVTGTATMNLVCESGTPYGIYGPTSGDFAVFQATSIVKKVYDSEHYNFVSYYNNLYVVTDSHFAQGNDGSEDHLYYFLEGNAVLYTGTDKPNVTINPTECNPGFTPGTPTPIPSSDIIRVICEDLSVKESTDWDFNDVVFDIQLVENNQAEITLLAAGGTLPLYIGDEDHEVHDLFAAVPENSDKGITRSTMINTGSTGNKYNLRNCKEAIFRLDILSDWTAGAGPSTSEEDLLKIVAKNLPVKVLKMVNGTKTWVTLMCEPGKATAKVAANGGKNGFEWCDERQHINRKYHYEDVYGNDYGGFTLFVQGFLNAENWHNYKGPITEEMSNGYTGQ